MSKIHSETTIFTCDFKIDKGQLFMLDPGVVPNFSDVRGYDGLHRDDTVADIACRYLKSKYKRFYIIDNGLDGEELLIRSVKKLPNAVCFSGADALESFIAGVKSKKLKVEDAILVVDDLYGNSINGTTNVIVVFLRELTAHLNRNNIYIPILSHQQMMTLCYKSKLIFYEVMKQFESSKQFVPLTLLVHRDKIREGIAEVKRLAPSKSFILKPLETSMAKGVIVVRDITQLEALGEELIRLLAMKVGKYKAIDISIKIGDLEKIALAELATHIQSGKAPDFFIQELIAEQDHRIGRFVAGVHRKSDGVIEVEYLCGYHEHAMKGSTEEISNRTLIARALPGAKSDFVSKHSDLSGDELAIIKAALPRLVEPFTILLNQPTEEFLLGQLRRVDLDQGRRNAIALKTTVAGLFFRLTPDVTLDLVRVGYKYSAILLIRQITLDLNRAHSPFAPLRNGLMEFFVSHHESMSFDLSDNNIFSEIEKFLNTISHMKECTSCKTVWAEDLQHIKKMTKIIVDSTVEQISRSYNELNPQLMIQNIQKVIDLIALVYPNNEHQLRLSIYIALIQSETLKLPNEVYKTCWKIALWLVTRSRYEDALLVVGDLVSKHAPEHHRAFIPRLKFVINVLKECQSHKESIYTFILKQYLLSPEEGVIKLCGTLGLKNTFEGNEYNAINLFVRYLSKNIKEMDDPSLIVLKKNLIAYLSDYHKAINQNTLTHSSTDKLAVQSSN